MGKRHKRRRMVNKIAPHKGPVFLAQTLTVQRMEASLRPLSPTMKAEWKELGHHLERMMDSLVTATLIPPEKLGMAGSTTIATLYRRKSP